MSEKVIAHCQWCGREMHISSRGRPRKFCSQACRQRSYEQRAELRPGASRPIELQIGAGDVDKHMLQRVNDGLFEIRCLAEDLDTAISEGWEPEQTRTVVKDLLMKAREVEHLTPKS